jgi:hypothetical protein
MSELVIGCSNAKLSVGANCGKKDVLDPIVFGMQSRIFFLKALNAEFEVLSKRGRR